MDLKRQKKKRPNRKEEFSKLDEFDLGVIRRIVPGYYARNETFSLKRLQKQLKEEIAFSYSISTLGFVLKKLGFRFKRQQRESVIHERSDLIACESFLKRTRSREGIKFTSRSKRWYSDWQRKFPRVSIIQ